MKRALIFAAGVVIILLGGIATLGLAWLGMLGMGVTWAVLRRRKSDVTRFRLWLAGSVTAAVVIMGFVVVGLAAAPAISTKDAERAIAQQQARIRDSLPPILKQLQKAQPPRTARADSITARLLSGKTGFGFRMWLGLTGGVFLSALFGSVAGFVGWAALMLFYRSLENRWLPATSAETPGGVIPL